MTEQSGDSFEMIARHWKALARREQADNYIEHLKHETFPQLSNMEGFVRAAILRRETEGRTEFLITTIWESEDAIQRFAGEQVTLAVVPEAVQAMMIEYEEYATHYEIVFG